jgi:hypothetical protein
LKFNWHPNILNTALEHPQTSLTLHNENKVTVTQMFMITEWKTGTENVHKDTRLY